VAHFSLLLASVQGAETVARRRTAQDSGRLLHAQGSRLDHVACPPLLRTVPRPVLSTPPSMPKRLKPLKFPTIPLCIPAAPLPPRPYKRRPRAPSSPRIHPQLGFHLSISPSLRRRSKNRRHHCPLLPTQLCHFPGR
jgi:hypothetical protein